VGAALSFRGGVQDRIVRLWGDRTAPFVEALVLARREHLAPEVRDAFALSGTAHLLAISGFHVGVVAALFLGLLRVAGVRPRRAGAAAALGCWFYVLGIGAPDAAVRAAVLLTLLSAAGLRGRPVVGVGALGAALLILLAVDPGSLASIGFQLSFAGTGGLLLLRRPVAELLSEVWRRVAGRDPPRRRDPGIGATLVRGGTDGIAAGVAATLPTLPLLAWHFDRFSLLGIPATLLLAPVVSAAIPGVAFSLLASLLAFPLGVFLAGGTGLLLAGVERLVLTLASLPGASLWVSRGVLIAAACGGGLAHLVVRRGWPQRVGPAVRQGTALGCATALALLVPVVPIGRSLEVHSIDVGQGDAIALRFPSGRWILVDAGPRSVGFDAGERRVVPYLKRWGARRLEAIVLTHPHLDHIGGTTAVMRNLDVRGIVDPARPYGSSPYLEILEEVGEREISWWPASRGTRFLLDDAVVTVLHPTSRDVGEADPDDPNDVSVVLLVRWREATLLLTGDAPAEVERALLDGMPPLALLKLGHHGSRTSTALELLEAASPAMAVVSVGEGNSFGHPHGEVTGWLEERGIRLLRTDRDGDVRIRLEADGSIHVRTSR
jgi:competence protein ComEC